MTRGQARDPGNPIETGAQIGIKEDFGKREPGDDGATVEVLGLGLRGHAPDTAASPRTEDDVVAILDWAQAANAAVIPFGGGTSVVGGIEPAVGDAFAGGLMMDVWFRGS